VLSRDRNVGEIGTGAPSCHHRECT
jgi:hypothetical protein